MQEAWRAVPSAYRRIVYRSLLAVGLFLTICERTIPSLGKIGQAAGNFIGALVKNSGIAMAEGLKAAIEAVLGLTAGETPRWLSWIIYLLVAVLLAAVSWELCPLGKGRLRYI